MNALKQARLDRGWSQSRLIAAMESEANRMSVALPGRASLKTQISRWENGHLTPDSLYQRIFERVYGMSGSDLDLHIADAVGLTIGTTWQQCVDSTAQLWSEDMKRRTFLQSATFAATAFTTPVLTALISDPAETVVRSNGQRSVAPRDVELIRDLTAKLNHLDNRHGGGRVRRLALTVLDEEVAPLLRSGNFTDAVGRDLLGAAAEVAQLVGWISHDMGHHGIAQRYLIQALGLAQSAGDSALTAELLCAMSQQSLYVDDPQAADLARAARSVAERRGHIALVAESRIMEAHAHARAGSSAACASALHQAEVALDKADRTDRPRWISYFDDAYVSAKFGHCLRELGDAKNAVRFAEQSLKMDPNYVRGQAFNLTLLAHAQSDGGDLSAACATGHRALDVVADLNSARAVRYLRDFRSSLSRAASTAEVRNLDIRLEAVLAA